MVNGQGSIVNSQGSIVNSQGTIVNGLWSTVYSQRSIVNGQQSIVNSQQSIANGKQSIVNSQWSIVKRERGGNKKMGVVVLRDRDTGHRESLTCSLFHTAFQADKLAACSDVNGRRRGRMLDGRHSRQVNRFPPATYLCTMRNSTCCRHRGHATC